MPDLTVRRIPGDVYRRLRDAAKSHGRSLNAEILAILTDEDGWVRRRAEVGTLLAELDDARKNLAQKYPHLSDSTRLIREDRDAR
jgi:plasmid stability protein